MFLALSKQCFINLDRVDCVNFRSDGLAEIVFNNVATVVDIGCQDRLREYFNAVAHTQRVEQELLDGLRARIGAVLYQNLTGQLVYQPEKNIIDPLRDRLIEVLFNLVELKGGDAS